MNSWAPGWNYVIVYIVTFFFFFEEEGIKMEMMGGKKFKL